MDIRVSRGSPPVWEGSTYPDEMDLRWSSEQERDRAKELRLKEDLAEMHSHLVKLKKMNHFLEAENTDLKNRLLSQLDRYPDAAEIRNLARHYGPRLAGNFTDLVDENKYLKVKLQQAHREEARANTRLSMLADGLRAKEQREFTRSLAADALYTPPERQKFLELTDSHAGSDADETTIPGSMRLQLKDEPGRPRARLRDGKHVRLHAMTDEHCQCTEKLQELMDSLDDNLQSYERGVWQMQVNVLEDERNELSMKVVSLRQRLAEVQSRIMGDPFLSAKFVETCTANVPTSSLHAQLQDTSARLALAEDVNSELERRLAFERSISRSWQTNLRAMQRELRDHLADLAVASRTSGMRCDLFRGEVLQAGQAAAQREVGGMTRSERESLRLLRQARSRIEADAKRLEVYSSRVAALEKEVKDLRLHNTTLEEGSARLTAWAAGRSAAQCIPPEDTVSTLAAAAAGNIYHSGLLVARQVLADRLVYHRALDEIRSRREELRDEALVQGDKSVADPPHLQAYSGSLQKAIARELVSRRTENVLADIRKREVKKLTRSIQDRGKISSKAEFWEEGDGDAEGKGAKKGKKRGDGVSSLSGEDERAEAKSDDDESVEEAEVVRVRLPEDAWFLDRDRQLVREVQLLRRLAGQRSSAGICPAFAEAMRPKDRKRGATAESTGAESRDKRNQESEEAKKSEYRKEKVKEEVDRREMGALEEEKRIRERVKLEDELKRLRAETKRVARNLEEDEELSRTKIREERELMKRRLELELDDMRRRLEDERQVLRQRMEEEEKRRREDWAREEERLRRLREAQKEEEDAYLKLREERRRREKEEEEKRREDRARLLREEEEERERRRAELARADEEEKSRREARRRQEEHEEEMRWRKKLEDEEEERKRKRRMEEEEERQRKQRFAEEEEKRRKQRLEEEEEAERRRQKKLQEEEEEERRRKQRLEEEEEERRRKQKLEEEEEERRRKQKLEEEEEERRRKQKLEEEEEERRRKQKLEEEEEERRRKLKLLEEEEERRRQKRLEEEDEAIRKRKQRLEEEEEERRIKRQLEEEEALRPKRMLEAREKEQRATEARAGEEGQRITAGETGESQKGWLAEQKETSEVLATDPPYTVVQEGGDEGKDSLQGKPAEEGGGVEVGKSNLLGEDQPAEVTPTSIEEPEDRHTQPARPTHTLAERLRLAATKVRTIAFFERAAKHKRAATVGKADVGSSENVGEFQTAVPSLRGKLPVGGPGELLPSSELSNGDLSTAPPTSDEQEDEESLSEEEEDDRPLVSESPRTALREKIYDKYNNLANAFKHMDKKKEGTVTVHEFANFLEECGFEYPFPEVHELYMQLAQPANLLTVTMFYRNLEGHASLTQLGKRLEDIFGNAAVPFEEEEIPEDGRVTKDKFIFIAGKAGLTPANADALWESIDVLKMGSLQRESVLLLLEDNVDVAEVKRVEEELAQHQGGFFSIFGGAGEVPRPSPKFSRHQTCARPTALTRKLELGFTDAEAAIDDVLESTEPLDALLPITRLEMIRKMTKKVYEPEDRIQEANDVACPLYVVLSGSVELLSPGLFVESVIDTKAAPFVLYSDEVVEGRPNERAAKAAVKCKTFLLSRQVYDEQFKDIEIERKQKVAEYMALVKTVPVLNKLDGFPARRLARTFGERHFEDGEPIIREFDEPDNFYLVKSGEAAVVKYKKVASGSSEEREEEVVRVYQKGDYFGEISIIKNQTRTATIKAKGECTVLSLPKKDFNAQLRKYETDFIRRAGRVYTAQGHFQKKSGAKKKKAQVPGFAASASGSAEDANIPLLGKQYGSIILSDNDSEETRKKRIEAMLADEEAKLRDECMLLLEAVPVLKDLPVAKRKEITEAMSLECYYPNTPIILQGEDARKFFVLKTGTVAAELFVGAGKPHRKLKEYSSACCLGEMALIKDEPRGCYVVAKSPVQLYSLKKEDFERLLKDAYPAFIEYAQAQYEQETLKRQESLNSLRRQQSRAQQDLDSEEITKLLLDVPVINMLSDTALEAVARAFKVETYQEREVIIHEGEAAKNFYIIYSGDVSVQKSPGDGQPHQEIVVLHRGEYLGEIAFLNEQPRTASCVAKTEVKLLSLSRDEFNLHLGSLTEAFVQQADAKYGGGTSKEAIPDWLVEAGEQNLLFDPSKKSSNDDDDDATTTSSFRGSVDMDKEKEMYKKKKERRHSSGAKKKSDSGEGEELKKKKEEGRSDASTVESNKQSKKEDGTEADTGEGTQEHKEKAEAIRGKDGKEKTGKDQKKDIKTAAKRKMSLAGGAALAAAAMAAKVASGDPGEEKHAEEAAPKETSAEQGENKSEKKEKKKKKSKSAAEGKGENEESTSGGSEVAEIRDLVRGTLKNKYGSIAQAFRQIDGNNSDSVDFEEFSAFVKNLRVQSLKKKDVQLLFDDLCQPEKGHLTVANLYRNIDKKDNLSKAEINLRWVEIFGSSKQAFHTVANVEYKEDCTQENFISVAERAGVSQENAERIWKELDKAEKGSMQTKIICAYMAGELTADEAAVKEEEHSSLANKFWSMFGGGGPDDDDEDQAGEAAAAQGDSDKIIEHALKWEDMAIVQRDDHRAYPSCTKRLVVLLKHKEGFENLQLLQLRYVASLMKRDTFVAGARVLEAGDEPLMVWCAWGQFKVLQAGFFGESEVRVVGPNEFFGLEELVHDTPLPASLVADIEGSVLWVLERDTFNDLVKDMMDARRAVVPLIETFLRAVPIVKDMTADEIKRVAQACKIEKFAPNQTVFRAGMPGDMFCFIFKGEITMLKPMGAGQEPIELGRLREGVYFGEMAFLKNQRRTASVIAATELTLFCLDKGSFETVLGRVKEKMIERAESMYMRQDVSSTEDTKSGDGAETSPNGQPAGQGDAPPVALDLSTAADQFVKKRTRKSSLALLAYAKMSRESGGGQSEGRDGVEEDESAAGEKKGDGEEEKRETQRWSMARDPQVIHEPPSADAIPRKSILRTSSSTVSSGRKNPVFFDETTLLPTPPSSDDEEEEET